MGLRKQALQHSRAALGYPVPPADAPAWGILMETGYPNGSATLLSMVDGSASLYLSSGGGIIGGGGHEAVRNAAKAFVQMAGSQVKLMSPAADNFPLPQNGKTIFYVLTDAGVLTAGAAEDDLGNQRHPLSPLFHAGQAVITELRLTDPRRSSVPPQIRLAEIFEKNNAPELKVMLDEGLDANTISPAGIPLLAVAIFQKQSDIVRVLLAAGANPNIPVTHQKAGFKAAPMINLAAANEETTILELLIEAKADIEAKDATGLTPLMCAAYSGKTVALNTLLKAGCSVEARDNFGYTALIFACNGGQAACVKILLANQADVNARDNDNSTPIMFAAQHGHDECVRLLLAAGADPKFKGKHGLSAIGFAKQNKRVQTEKILLGAG